MDARHVATTIGWLPRSPSCLLEREEGDKWGMWAGPSILLYGPQYSVDYVLLYSLFFILFYLLHLFSILNSCQKNVVIYEK